MNAAPFPVIGRQVPPGRSGSQHPKHRIDKPAVILSDSYPLTTTTQGQARVNKEDRGKDPVSGPYPCDHYDCSTYALTFRHYRQECFSCYISIGVLWALILDMNKTVRKIRTVLLPFKREGGFSIEFQKLWGQSRSNWDQWRNQRCPQGYLVRTVREYPSKIEDSEPSAATACSMATVSPTLRVTTSRFWAAEME